MPPPPPAKIYLGDGIYASVDRHGALVITTENGIEATNTIIFDFHEPQLISALEEYFAEYRKWRDQCRAWSA